MAAAQLTAKQERHLNVQRKKLRKIHQEFWDLPTNHQEKPMVFGSQHKNRYKTILPNEHSRVILKPELGDVTRTEPYINANYIKVGDQGVDMVVRLLILSFLLGSHRWYTRVELHCNPGTDGQHGV